MARFLHIADVQVGMHATDAHRIASKLREERVQALLRAMEVARVEGVEFIVSAGDLFEDNLVDNTEAQRVVEALKGAGVPVYLLPGNHDALTANSVYRRSVFSGTERLHVLSEPAPVVVPGTGCTLYPCPLTQRTTLGDPTDWIAPRRDGDGLRVAIAHGDVVSFGAETSAPRIPADVAERRALDYVAMGHWHSQYVYEGQRLAYPGTPETTRFGERDSGHVLVVDLPGAGAVPTIRKVRVGRLRWEEWRVEVGPHSLDWREGLQRRVESLENPACTLLRVELSGTVPSANLGMMTDIQQYLEALVLNGQLFHAELRGSLRSTEQLGRLLEAAIEREPILADVIAELRLMEADGQVDVSSLNGNPRPVSELVGVWEATGLGESVPMAAAAQRAIQLLQQIVGEDG